MKFETVETCPFAPVIWIGGIGSTKLGVST